MTFAQQPQLGGMPRRLYPATPTRLTTWLECPRRYRFAYLDRPAPPKGPPWAHNSLGASIHLALADWWRLPLAGRTPESAGRLLDRNWMTDGFADDAQAERWRRRAKDMVERYVRRLDPEVEPRGVERTVAVTYGGTALSGRVDRIDERPRAEGQTELVVVDYKTGRHVLTLDDVRTSLALAIYAAATARTLRGECLRVELHHLPTGQVIGWEHSSESLVRHLRRADAIGAECAQADDRFHAGLAPEEADGLFPPQPGALCGWCDFVRICRDGQAAARPRRPWDGLAED